MSLTLTVSGTVEITEYEVSVTYQTFGLMPGAQEVEGWGYTLEDALKEVADQVEDLEADARENGDTAFPEDAVGTVQEVILGFDADEVDSLLADNMEPEGLTVQASADTNANDKDKTVMVFLTVSAHGELEEVESIKQA